MSQDTIRLRNRHLPKRNASSGPARAVTIIFAIALFVMIPVIFIKPFGAALLDLEAWKTGIEVARQKLEENVESEWFWFEAGLSIVIPAFIAVGLYCTTKQRLIIDRQRIYDSMPLLNIFQPFGTAVNVTISEISHGELRRSTFGSHVEPYLLVLTTRQGKTHKILPLKWIDENEQQQPFQMSSLLRMTRKPEIANPFESPIVEALIQRGISITMEEPSSRNEILTFDVASSKSAIAVFVLGLSLGVYGFVDLVETRLAYLGEPPFVLFAMIGIGIGLATALLLKRTQVPGQVSLGLGIFLAVAAAFASYPGVLRVNDLLADEPAHKIPYMVQPGYVLRALEGDWADIVIEERVLWPVTPTGQKYTMSVRKGGLDVLYVDMSPIYDQASEHYSSNR